MLLQIKTYTTNSPEYLQSLLLRYKILRIPLGLTYEPKDFENDKTDIHVGIFRGDTIVGCLILARGKNATLKMRQVAVDNNLQQQGIGTQLVQFSELYASKNNYKKIYCHARKTAMPFYLKLGYHVVGEEFVEVNLPHVYMEKTI